MESQPELSIYASRDKLSVALADYVARQGSIATTRRGRFCIAPSGGSLMDVIGPHLSASSLSSTIGRASWHVFWADERWVPKNSPESNYHDADRLFLSRVGIPTEQIHAADDSLDPSETASVYETAIGNVLKPKSGRLPRFDLVLLGIGEDGHTASLFPNHPALRETQNWAVPIIDAPKPPPIRITMTLPVINNARSVLFVATGSNKAKILSKVFNRNGTDPQLPVHLVTPSDGELGWYLDRSAAADLF